MNHIGLNLVSWCLPDKQSQVEVPWKTKSLNSGLIYLKRLAYIASLIPPHQVIAYHKYLRNDELMMMNCFCGMGNRRKAFNLIFSRNRCLRFSRSQISDMPRAGLESAQNLNSGFVEWSCAAVITTTPRRYKLYFSLPPTALLKATKVTWKWKDFAKG